MMQTIEKQRRSAYLCSIDDRLNVAVIRASGGIGAALTDMISREIPGATVHAFARRPLTDIPDTVKAWEIELENESLIADAARRVRQYKAPLGTVFVNTGLLHDGETAQPEKSWRALNAYSLEQAFRINTIGPALVAKHFLPLMRRSGKSVFACLSAGVGSMEDNRLGGWHAYRASKAALNMIIKTLSIELSRRNPKVICVGLHPGTIDTDMSRPFQGNIRPEKLFTPKRASEALLSVVDDLTVSDSGKIFAWDGSVIPY